MLLKESESFTADYDPPGICPNCFPTSPAGLCLVLTAPCRGGGRGGQVGSGPACLPSSEALGWAAFSADSLAGRVPEIRYVVPTRSHVNSSSFFPTREPWLFGESDAAQAKPALQLSQLLPGMQWVAAAPAPTGPSGPRFRKHPSPPTPMAQLTPIL